MWSHYPNKNVSNDRLNWPYDSPGCLRSGGKLFHTLVPADAKVLSPKLLDVRLTASVRVSSERSCLTRYVGNELIVVHQVARSVV